MRSLALGRVGKWAYGQCSEGTVSEVPLGCSVDIASEAASTSQSMASTPQNRRKEDGARILQIGFAVASYCTNFVQSSDSTVEIENDRSKTKERKTKRKKKGKNLTLV